MSRTLVLDVEKLPGSSESFKSPDDKKARFGSFDSANSSEGGKPQLADRMEETYPVA